MCFCRLIGLIVISCLMVVVGHGALAADRPTVGWGEETRYQAERLTVFLSQPRLVHRSAGFLWFPSLEILGDNQLMAIMSTYADQAQDVTPGVVSFSGDNGLTWSKPRPCKYGELAILGPDRRPLVMPYYLRLDSAQRATGAAQRVVVAEERLEAVESPVEVVGWPRPLGLLDADLGHPRAEWKLASFVFNGQSVLSTDRKTHLATLYGRFAGTKRYSLVLAESQNGLKWTIRSTIADETCRLRGAEGPCESAVVRLKDGRLLVVFRLDSGVPYGHSFSRDDGKTWTEPKALDGPYSVQPSLSGSRDGMLLLSGGRPGLSLWINPAGDAQRWFPLDLAAHHNRWIRDEPIHKAEVSEQSNSSAYTEVRWLDASQFVVLYDRLPHGWKAIPKGSTASNSIWIVRGRVK